MMEASSSPHWLNAKPCKTSEHATLRLAAHAQWSAFRPILSIAASVLFWHENRVILFWHHQLEFFFAHQKKYRMLNLFRKHFCKWLHTSKNFIKTARAYLMLKSKCHYQKLFSQNSSFFSSDILIIQMWEKYIRWSTLYQT